MAGRGVDIILGGQPPSSFEMEYQNASGKKKFDEEQTKWQKEHDKVIETGGLLVIGTEKHESRRIDNQLRGRSGRQGDPGKSVFIISLEDDLMRIFGGDQISGLMTRFNFPEDQPLTHGLVSRVITSAQSKVEGHNFESRKHLLEYDDVLNQQREIIYKMRREIVEKDEPQTESIMEKVKEAVAGIVMSNENPENGRESNQKIIAEFATIVPFDEQSQHHLFHQLEKNQNPEEKIEFLSKLALDIQKKREETYGKEITEKIAKVVTLTTIDNLWMDHLTSIDDLRTGINLRGYAQKDPLVEYKNEAFGMFERLISAINDGVVSRFFRMNPAQAPAPEQMPTHISTNQPESETSQDHRSKSKSSQKKNGTNSDDSSAKKMSRNDPCWCGSGKKWKKCHYPEMGNV
jgi:preprotein translocase subunit SecA